MTKQQICDAARKCIGFKWRHQGRTATGMDCVGLLYAVANGCGVATENVTNYRHAPGSAPLVAELQKYCIEVERTERQPGDILIVSIAGEDPNHTMILTNDNTVVHASARDRKVVEHRLDEKTENGICRVFRFKDVV